jgi:hypothetical protein
MADLRGFSGKKSRVFPADEEISSGFFLKIGSIY